MYDFTVVSRFVQEVWKGKTSNQVSIYVDPQPKPKGPRGLNYKILEVLGALVMGLYHGCKRPRGIALVLLVMILDGVPDPDPIKYTLWQIGL